MNQRRHVVVQRSPAMQEVISTKPSFLVQWGNLLLLCFLIASVAATWFIRYPNTLQVEARLTTNASARDEYAAELLIPMSDAKQVAVGQTVALKFPAYPVEDYGSVIGKIEFIDQSLRKEKAFVASVSLTKGLVTTHHKKIPYREGLMAKAEVSTNNFRLLEQFYRSFISKKESRQ